MKIYTQQYDSEEQGAVVSARTSRSPNSFDVILKEVREKGYKEFLKTNVLGYGHDSVAEVATTPVVLIEDISDIAANVIATADPQLVVQMKSTRYQDMGACTAYDRGMRENNPRGEAMKLYYMVGMQEIQKILDATDHVKKRTLQCDIARTFLPAGISTQVAIRGNARTMRDTVAFCLGHELEEVRVAGAKIQEAVKEHIDVLFDRHVVAAPGVGLFAGSKTNDLMPGEAVFEGKDWRDPGERKGLIAELGEWRKSGYRRRMRMAAAPHGPFMPATISSDYGAYRDLRRNRTIHQDDVLPNPMSVPTDSLWAFRDLYPDVCDKIMNLPQWSCHHDSFITDDPYLAPMGSLMTWHAGGHVLNWAYGLRLRSYAEAGNLKAGCHPAYAMPMRHLMRQIRSQAGWLADAMGIVKSPKSWLGVEFEDRVPA